MKTLKHLKMNDILSTNFDGHLDRHYYAAYTDYLQKVLLTNPSNSGEIKAKMNEIRESYLRHSKAKSRETFLKNRKKREPQCFIIESQLQALPDAVTLN